MTGTLAASGDWSVRFPVPDRRKIYAILRSTCWFQHGKTKRIVLHEGDVVLLTTHREYVLGNRICGPRSACGRSARRSRSRLRSTERRGERGECLAPVRDRVLLVGPELGHRSLAVPDEE